MLGRTRSSGLGVLYRFVREENQLEEKNSDRALVDPGGKWFCVLRPWGDYRKAKVFGLRRDYIHWRNLEGFPMAFSSKRDPTGRF